MRIGIAGLNAAGKTEVVGMLERRGFYRGSLSDVIRESLRAEGLAPTRDRMIERGRALRGEHGLGVLAERVQRSLPEDRNHVIDSIRHPAEVASLRAGGELLLIWVEASPGIRFARATARGRTGDASTLGGFLEVESRELAAEEESGQKLLAVRELADEVISNDGDLAALEQHLDELLDGRLLFRERPSWDEYFMSIARVVSARSNCVKRKVGSIITSDRRIISTGYNGTPRGLQNCNEGGCPRCNRAAESGTRLDECLCSHAEENAITQSAYHGVSVRGGTLFTTLCPCLMCTKMIVNAGLAEVVYDSPFPTGDISLELLHEAGLKVRRFNESGEAG
jgi:dCMP deaminase